MNAINLRILFLLIVSIIVMSDTIVAQKKTPEPIISKKVGYSKKLDKKLEEAIRLWRGETDKREIRYHFNKVDLNGDKRLDAVVSVLDFLECGTGGCPMLVFRGDEESGFKLVTEMSVSRPPLIVLSTKTNGWRDLVMYVSGGGIKPFYALLRFDGKSYPENPTVEAEIPKKRNVRGVEYLSDVESYDTGFLLK